TPRRCDCESRPLRELPCPFLVAMSSQLLSTKSGVDRRDLDAGQLRAEANGLALLLAALHLEHPDLLALGLFFDDARHGGASDVGGTGRHVTAVGADKQHAVEREFRARLEVQVINNNDRAWRDFFLPAAGFDNGEHFRLSPKTKVHLQ